MNVDAYIETLKEKGLNNEEITELVEVLNKKQSFQEKLNENIRKAMHYVGFVLAGLGMVGYLITMLLLVIGTGSMQFELIGKDGIFFVINLSFGIFVRTGFYLQGIKFAKLYFSSILEEYDSVKLVNKKESKLHSFEFKTAISYLLATSFQVAWFFVFSIGVIYLSGLEGMQNWIYFWNALSNLFMFTGFGFLALNSAYEKYALLKIPVIKERTRKIKLKQTDNK